MTAATRTRLARGDDARRVLARLKRELRSYVSLLRSEPQSDRARGQLEALRLVQDVLFTSERLTRRT